MTDKTNNAQVSVYTPCRAACKNNAGICSGCHRTLNELSDWRHLSNTDRQTKMNQISGTDSTHVCEQCGAPAFCEIAAGNESCWCFEIDKRDTSSLTTSKLCLCRQCLSALPVK